MSGWGLCWDPARGSPRIRTKPSSLGNSPISSRAKVTVLSITLQHTLPKQCLEICCTPRLLGGFGVRSSPGGGAWSLFPGSMPLGGPSLSPLPWSSCPSLVLNVSMFLPPAPRVQHVVKTTAGGVDGVDEIVMTVDFFGGVGGLRSLPKLLKAISNRYCLSLFCWQRVRGLRVMFTCMFLSFLHRIVANLLIFEALSHCLLFVSTRK